MRGTLQKDRPRMKAVFSVNRNVANSLAPSSIRIISSRKCCKPGSVSPVLQAGQALAPRAVAIYLWHPKMPSVPSVWFLQDGSPTKFGFLARRVYRVPSFLSPEKLRFCGTFSVLGPQREPFPRRQQSLRLTALACARYEHSKHLSLGEPGLSSTANRRSDCGSDYPHFPHSRISITYFITCALHGQLTEAGMLAFDPLANL